MQSLRLNTDTVRVDAGELVSYHVNGREVIHQKGSPGWRSADTEMFPIIGPTAAAGFNVSTPRGPATQDQHGLLRELSYNAGIASETKAAYDKHYIANQEVANAKFPNKSSAEQLAWPYNFHFRKTFELLDDGLRVGFEISGETGMPYMLGYHPAFRLTAEAAYVHITAGSRKYALEDVLAVGDRALYVPDCSDISLYDGDAGVVQLQTEGFGHFMLWAPVPTMICVEPITFYPYDVRQDRLHEGFRTLTEDAFASVLITAH